MFGFTKIFVYLYVQVRADPPACEESAAATAAIANPSLPAWEKANCLAVNFMSPSSMECEDHTLASVWQAEELAAFNGFDAGSVSCCAATGGSELLASALKNAWDLQVPIPDPPQYAQCASTSIPVAPSPQVTSTRQLQLLLAIADVCKMFRMQRIGLRV